MKRKDKIAAGLEKPPVSKYEAKRAAKRSASQADSPFAVLASLDPIDERTGHPTSYGRAKA